MDEWTRERYGPAPLGPPRSPVDDVDDDVGMLRRQQARRQVLAEALTTRRGRCPVCGIGLRIVSTVVPAHSSNRRLCRGTGREAVDGGT